LFQLVLHRSNDGYWDAAEYHLGCIESKFENTRSAHFHFIECLKLNPGHSKARRALNKPSVYREIETNVFEAIDQTGPAKILFIAFGSLGHVVHAFPVIAALREKLHAETVWLTSPQYASLARTSVADSVRESEPAGIIPWDWIQANGFTHVFSPDPAANLEDWSDSNLHAIDFMARKCGVQLKTHKTGLEPGSAALFEAEEFLREHNLRRDGFITASCETDGSRHWPRSNVMTLAQQAGVPTVVLLKRGDPVIPGTIACIDKPFEVMAALIRWSRFYLGANSGISWLATTTPTPMAVFLDPAGPDRVQAGFRDVLAREKTDIEEFDIYTGIPAVLEHIERKILIGA
jgi:hypothetical protein